MAELRRLRDHFDLGLDDSFLSTEDPKSLVSCTDEYDTEIVRSDIDLVAIDNLLEQTMGNHEQDDAPSSDRNTAIAFHRLLPLTRREASDKRLWAWLGIVQFPHFVAWRWGPNKDTGLRSSERFNGSAVRQAFARLWWAAELTKTDSDDYSLTEKLLGLSGFQDIYEAIFGRAFCQYRPAIKAFIETVGSEKNAVIRNSAKEFGYILTTLLLESMNEDELEKLLQDIVGELKAA